MLELLHQFVMSFQDFLSSASGAAQGPIYRGLSCHCSRPKFESHPVHPLLQVTHPQPTFLSAKCLKKDDSAQKRNLPTVQLKALIREIMMEMSIS